MDVTPNDSTSKRTRAKATKPTQDAAAQKPKAPRKTLSTTRKKPITVEAATLTQTTASADLSEMIATAAFYLAAERSFAPGHELDDWLEAERRIRSMHAI